MAHCDNFVLIHLLPKPNVSLNFVLIHFPSKPKVSLNVVCCQFRQYSLGAFDPLAELTSTP